MNEQEVRDLLRKAYDGRSGEFAVIKSQIEKFVMAVLVDAKGAITELATLDDALNLLINIIDDKTNSGLLDLIDGPLVKLAVSKILNDKMRTWYIEERKKILESAENAGI